ncbi:hypothetical protein [Serratia fonticola]
MYKALDILINIGCYALAAFVMYPGIKRLVEGPEVFMLNGQPGSEVISTIDTPAYAFMQIGLGCLIIILGQIIRSKLKRYAKA